MKKSKNYGFNLPEANDFYDIEHMNANFAEVDKKLKEHEDGTTAVGNANKLGGKGASEYFLKSGGDIDGTLHARGATDTPIYNHANSSNDESYIGYAVGDILRGYIGFKNGKAHIHNVGDIATTADLANYLPTDGNRSTLNPVSDLDNFLTGVGLFRDGTLNLPHGTGYWLIIAGGLVGTGIQLAVDLFNTACIKMRNCASGTWGAWGDANVGLADYLPLSGGTLSKGSVLAFEKTDDSTLSGDLGIGFYGNAFEIWERGGGNRGAKLDLSKCVGGTGSELLHTGNSAKVAIQETAPTDTSALWVW